MTEAFSRESPSSSARIFVAVALLANRSSAIAPTISCPSGAYACAPGNWRAVRITDKSRERGKEEDQSGELLRRFVHRRFVNAGSNRSLRLYALANVGRASEAPDFPVPLL